MSDESDKTANAHVVGGAASLVLGQLVGGRVGSLAQEVGVTVLRRGLQTKARTLVQRHRGQLGALKDILSALEQLEERPPSSGTPHT